MKKKEKIVLLEKKIERMETFIKGLIPLNKRLFAKKKIKNFLHSEMFGNETIICTSSPEEKYSKVKILTKKKIK